MTLTDEECQNRKKFKDDLLGIRDTYDKKISRATDLCNAVRSKMCLDMIDRMKDTSKLNHKNYQKALDNYRPCEKND